jgi:hypothetical protein
LAVQHGRIFCNDPVGRTLSAIDQFLLLYAALYSLHKERGGSLVATASLYTDQRLETCS